MIVRFTMNGEPAAWDVHPGETLFEALKREGHYTTKRGCSTGDCGVCIVTIDGENVHSCQAFAGSVEGQDVCSLDGVVYRDKKTGEVVVRRKPAPTESTAAGA